LATLPTGTVTFLFSDIEGSTRLLEALERDYGDPRPSGSYCAPTRRRSAPERVWRSFARRPRWRLAETAGRPAAAARLREVVETFSEGFETHQLLEARALLDEVAASGV